MNILKNYCMLITFMKFIDSSLQQSWIFGGFFAGDEMILSWVFDGIVITMPVNFVTAFKFESGTIRKQAPLEIMYFFLLRPAIIKRMWLNLSEFSDYSR